MAGTLVEDADYRFYLSLRPDLLESNAGEYALIRDGRLAGIFPTAMDAFEEGKRRFGAGGSLIVHIGAEAGFPPISAPPRRLGRSRRGPLVDNPIREVELRPPA